MIEPLDLPDVKLITPPTYSSFALVLSGHKNNIWY